MHRTTRQSKLSATCTSVQQAPASLRGGFEILLLTTAYVRHVQAANRKKLAVAGATGSKVMKLNIAMQYLTENSRFAGGGSIPLCNPQT